MYQTSLPVEQRLHQNLIHGSRFYVSRSSRASTLSLYIYLVLVRIVGRLVSHDFRYVNIIAGSGQADGA